MPIIDAFPVLRQEIDAAPAARDGETFYILYDRSGMAQSRLLVSSLGLLIAGRLDGTASILDISDNLSREFGNDIPCAEIEKVVAALEEALFLNDDRFNDYLAQAERDFRSASIRPACSAGSAYDNDPESLAKELDAMLAEAPPPEEPLQCQTTPRGMIVPHIDYHRGAAGYGQAYRFLAETPRPETVVVIGTAHVPLHERFSLCIKDFDTPFGPVGVDRDLAERIRLALRPHCDVERDLLAHRGEHSIELQAVWLRHIYGPGVRIVPILASSLGEFLEGDRPASEAAAEPAIRSLAHCLTEAVEGGGVMLMASADLSHVGPRFGDVEEVTDSFLARVEEVDRAYARALAHDPVAGLESLANHGDRHHVCGTACIFAVGLALRGTTGRLLGYHQAVNPEMRQAVSFAAMAYH